MDKGASATFEGRARFTDNSVMSFYADEYKMRNGGAVFNKVRTIHPTMWGQVM